jgi:nicotinate-nucleotide--dimethylbenzimidazole phosphoribosyltransferase
MTDTGQIPGEGLPGNPVGDAARQPYTDVPGNGVPQQLGWGADQQPSPVPPGFPDQQAAELGEPAYTYLDHPAAPGAGLDDEDDVLLMPGPQGSWSDPQPVPPQRYDAPSVLDGVAPLPAMEPVGSGPVAAAPAPRRPLHMGPPLPDAPSGGVSVRSLADRGPAVRASGPPTSGPEYLDVPLDGTAAIPAQQTGEPSNPAAPTPGSAWPAAPTGPAAPEVPAASQQSLIPHADSIVAPQHFAPAQPAAPAAEGPQFAVPAEQGDSGGGVPPEQAVGAAPEHLVPEQAGGGAVSAAPVAAPPEAVPVPTPAPVAESAPEPVAAAVPVQPVPVQPVPGQAVPVQPVPEQSAPVQSAQPVSEQAGGGAAEAVSVPESVEGGATGVAAAPEAVVAAAPAVGEVAAVPSTPEGTPAADAVPGAPEAVAPGGGTPLPPATVAPPASSASPAPAVPGVPGDAGATDPAATAVDEAAPAPAAQSTPVDPAGSTDFAAGVLVQAPAPGTPAAADSAPPAPEVADGQGDFVVPAPAGDSSPDPEAITADPPDPQQPAEPGTAAGAGKGRRRRAAPAGGEAPASEEDAGAAAEPYEPAVRDAVHRVIRERRDIRNGFRSDPIPHDVLLRVLEAAHTAPSVGHSQPWDFVVIRSEKTREKMHELAMLQREVYAKSLPKARARQFRELKIEAILDTPVNIVVTADPTRGGQHTLGRHTQPQMAPYSSALAVENLWLAARAEGLGVGWVSFFDERQMVAELALPEHLEVVAYLCIGYVDEFPDEPELMHAGWSKRRPLSWVVHDEEYGNRALPGEEPHDLLDETLGGIRPLDAKALGEAWERQKRMTKPSGALGMLEIISAQLSGLSRQCPPPIPEPAAVAIFAGDHGVHAQGVTAWPQEVTAQMVANFLGGGAVCNAFANQVGAEVCVIDVGVASELPTTPGLLPRKVRAGTADFTVGPAMTREEALRAVEIGIETARDLVAAGNKALLTGEMGIANTTTSAALIAVFTGVDPAEVTGRGTGINDEMHARKIEVVRRGLELHRPDPADPISVLAAIGGLEHAALVGFLLGAAALRTPVILDGVSAGAAALVARAIAPEVLAACIAGHRSAEPGHGAALTTLGLRPLVDLDLRLGEGTGALLALPLVQSAARVMHEVATFDAAGVTEKA